MPRTINLAAVQMDANPAPTAERLARAERLVREAATAGAQLVVLPELFNTGYSYAADLIERAETDDGPTATWLHHIAAHAAVHLAGTFLRFDGHDVYNTLLLVAPDGRSWRYDKRYPWGWERRAYRAGGQRMVAETELGRLGMLICWDTAHRNLWQEYAGKIDVMLIASCPPDVTNATYHFANGARLTLDQMGRLMRPIHNTARQLFGTMINEQTAWLGVPAVNSVGSGAIRTPVPRGVAMMLGLLPTAPHVLRYLPYARQMELSCAMTQGCKVVDGSGAVLTELDQAAGEAWTMATVTLADQPPRPDRPQPPARMPKASYLISDVTLPRMMAPLYQSGVRRLRQAGTPSPPSGRFWVYGLGLALLVFVAVRLRRHGQTQ